MSKHTNGRVLFISVPTKNAHGQFLQFQISANIVPSVYTKKDGTPSNCFGNWVLREFRDGVAVKRCKTNVKKAVELCRTYGAEKQFYSIFKEIPKIDKWALYRVEQQADIDGAFCDNFSYFIDEYLTSDDANEIHTFLRQLAKRGLTCGRGVCRVEKYNGDVLELVNKKTGEVYYRAILQY